MTRFSSTIVRYWLTALVTLAISFSVCFSAVADPVGPASNDRHITKSVVKELLHKHLSNHEMDDEISQRFIKSYLEMLDPWKVYFYQSDIDALLKRQNELDDDVRRGDVRFAYKAFNTLLTRIDQRLKVIDELLAEEHDFAVEESMVSDPDLVRYPQTAAEARDRWRKRIKYDLLLLKVDEIEGEKAIEKLRRRYHSFAKRMHQTDAQDLLEMYLTSLTTSFDPHTSYMAPKTLENFEIMMRLQLDGIGASLQSEDGYTLVKRIVPGGAADKDGRLKVEDKIVGVGQDVEGEVVDVVDMKLSDVVQLIRGRRGTVVRLEVVPGDGSKRNIINITRAKIELKDSEAQSAVFDAGIGPDNKPYKIGVIDLPSFYMDMAGLRRGNLNFKSTTRDVEQILRDFSAQGVSAVVLDLRRNGGGSLTEAINLTGLFIDQGPVVQVKGRPSGNGNAHVQQYYDRNPGVAWTGPVVVLTSKLSASASEILAGAIKDYRRGLIVGDKTTHGKGTVQSLVDLGEKMFPGLSNAPTLGTLKVTIQQFYRPSGKSTQKCGVMADVELPSITTHLDVGEADLDYPVEFDRVEASRFDRVDDVNPALCKQLRLLSQQRCSQSEKFQKEMDRITRYKQQKVKKQISLHEETFLEERAELNADKEQEKTLEKLNDPATSMEIERDYYLDEALDITVDYLNLLQTPADKYAQPKTRAQAWDH